MIWLALLLGLVLGCAGIFYGLLRVAAKWGAEGLELQQYGVETIGRVTERRRHNRRGSHIRYEYVDQFGARHRSRRNLVTPEAWDAHDEGGPVAIVYSQRNPRVSLPKYLLDLQPSSADRRLP